MKKLIYTINYGGYDPVHEPLQITPGWDYVLYTDNRKLKSKHWNVVYYDEPLPRNLMARKVYILHEAFAPGYDVSIAIGGQMQIACNLDRFLDDKMPDGYDMAVAWHPERNNIYQEIRACVQFRKFDLSHAKMLENRYRAMPHVYNLPQLAVIIRRGGVEALNQWEHKWWEETQIALRDQIAFSYCLWKYPEIQVKYYPYSEIKRSFYKHKHNKR